MVSIEPAGTTAVILLGSNALESLSDKAGYKTLAGMSHLASMACGRVRRHLSAEYALAAVERYPDGQAQVSALSKTLRILSTQAPALAPESAALVAEAKQRPTIGAFTIRVHGHAQIDQIVTWPNSAMCTRVVPSTSDHWGLGSND
jgi:hypothetical protein